MSQIETVRDYIIERLPNLIQSKDSDIRLFYYKYKDEEAKSLLIVEEKIREDRLLLFENGFKLSLSDEELEFKADLYAFNFGGEFYYIKKEELKEPKLYILRYLGENVSDLQKNTEFVHLGIHSSQELLNGCQKYSFWCDKANYLGMKALGICEKNTLSGAIKFQDACKKAKIKSILGEEVTVKINENFYIFKLYVKNDIGWKNLINISNIIRVFSFDENIPCISEEDLLSYSEGLFIILPNNFPFSSKRLKLYQKFEIYYQIDTVEFSNPDTYFLYLSNIKNYLEDWSGEVSPILLCDAYYLEQEDRVIQKALNKIKGDADLKDIVETQHFKTVDEHYNIFKQYWVGKEDIFEGVFNEAVENTKVLSEECNFEIKMKQLHLPKAMIDGVEEKENLHFFEKLIQKGMDKYGFNGIEKYEERVKEEFNVIVGADLENYFLILWDIVNHCKKVDNYIGVGRGSAAGSLISYLVGITKINPFDYDLLFSRFLNAGRVAQVVYDIYLDDILLEEYKDISKLNIVNCTDLRPFELSIGTKIGDKIITKIDKKYKGHISMPDIDLDIENREEVKQYLIQKYGRDKFAVIGSYNTFKIKAGLKDLARVLGTNLDYSALNILTSTLFFKEGMDAFFEEIFRTGSDNSFFKDFIQNNGKLINTLFWIIDTPKSSSIHPCACMLVPSDEDIFDNFPMFSQEEEFVCEWEGSELDDLGFLKEDLLGLAQLSFFHHILSLVKEGGKGEIDIFNLPLEDEEVYSYFQNGWNSEVFQFGSNLLISYCKLLKPTEINDLIAAVAAVRPGPMNNGLHLKYVKRKNGEEDVEYKFGYSEFTKETYGLILYQEQLMKIASYLGDLDLIESDGLRKALGKKIMSQMIEFKEKIKPNAVKKGCPPEEFEEIWLEMVEFAKYAFNKSHSVAYSVTGYISQYLKVYYQVEFWTAAFQKANNSDKRKEKFNKYFQELQESKSPIKVVSPEINIASNKISFSGNEIYFPLNNIKFLSDNGVEFILAERNKNGQFYSFEEFLLRMGKDKSLNKREFENLILAGAFDKLEDIKDIKDRARLITTLYNYFKRDFKEFITGIEDEKVFWHLKQWDLLGISYLPYKRLCSRHFDRYSYFKVFKQAEEGQKIAFGGIILSYKEKKTKKGKIFGEVILENDNVPYILMIFDAEKWEEYKERIDLYQNSGIMLFEAEFTLNPMKKSLQLQLLEDTIPIFISGKHEIIKIPLVSYTKFDKVLLDSGIEGTIVKYPSNAEIMIEYIKEGSDKPEYIVVNKSNISKLIEKYQKN